VLYQPNSLKIEDSVWADCSKGVDRNLWVVITRVKQTPVTLDAAPTNPNDLDVAFSTYRGDEPLPPTPPTKPTKNFTISPIKDVSTNNKTFMVNPATLQNVIQPHIMVADRPVTYSFEGTY
jgi:hypothetical protein